MRVVERVHSLSRQEAQEILLLCFVDVYLRDTRTRRAINDFVRAEPSEEQKKHNRRDVAIFNELLMTGTRVSGPQL